jgi:uncharacterized protein
MPTLHDMTEEDITHWSTVFETAIESGDPAHDLEHIRRVVRNIKNLARIENLSLEVLLPAAWLHDCIHVPKNSPERSKASSLAADHALTILKSQSYPEEHFEAIHHAIEAHSFSAKITPRTLEAKVLQDADRIDALGAVGISRCLMLGGHMGSDLYHIDDPFVVNRSINDAKYCVDHFYAKLLGLKDTMHTRAGKALAGERTQFLIDFLNQLGSEIGRTP